MPMGSVAKEMPMRTVRANKFAIGQQGSGWAPARKDQTASSKQVEEEQVEVVAVVGDNGGEGHPNDEAWQGRRRQPVVGQLGGEGRTAADCNEEAHVARHCGSSTMN